MEVFAVVAGLQGFFRYAYANHRLVEGIRVVMGD